MLDYSITFNPQQLRGVLGSLQLVSRALTVRPNIQDAVVHYRIRTSRTDPDSPFNQNSGYVYDFSSSCSNTVAQLDKFAGSLIDHGRSLETKSFSALEFIADNVPFTAGRRTSIVAITTSFSDYSDSLTRIQTEIDRIKNKTSTENTTQFFSIGIEAQSTDIRDRVIEELKALADGIERNMQYVEYDDFIDTLLTLLVQENILCPSDSKCDWQISGHGVRGNFFCSLKP